MPLFADMASPFLTVEINSMVLGVFSVLSEKWIIKQRRSEPAYVTPPIVLPLVLSRHKSTRALYLLV